MDLIRAAVHHEMSKGASLPQLLETVLDLPGVTHASVDQSVHDEVTLRVTLDAPPQFIPIKIQTIVVDEPEVEFAPPEVPASVLEYTDFSYTTRREDEVDDEFRQRILNSVLDEAK